MILVVKFRGSIYSWEAVRFPVERKENYQGGGLGIIYSLYSSGGLKGQDSKMWID